MADPSNLWSLLDNNIDTQLDNQDHFRQYQQHPQQFQQYLQALGIVPFELEHIGQLPGQQQLKDEMMDIVQQLGQQSGPYRRQYRSRSSEDILKIVKNVKEEMKKFGLHQYEVESALFNGKTQVIRYIEQVASRKRWPNLSRSVQQRIEVLCDWLKWSDERKLQMRNGKRSRSNSEQHGASEQNKIDENEETEDVEASMEQVEQQPDQHSRSSQQQPAEIIDNMHQQLKNIRMSQNHLSIGLFGSRATIPNVSYRTKDKTWDELKEHEKEAFEKMCDWLKWDEDKKKELRIKVKTQLKNGAPEKVEVDENVEPEDVETSIARLLPLDVLSDNPKETGEMIKFQMEYHGISMDMLTRKILGVDIKTIQENGRNVELMKQLIGANGLMELFAWWMMNGKERMEWARATRKEYGIQIDGLTPFEMEQSQKPLTEEETNKKLTDQLRIPLISFNIN